MSFIDGADGYVEFQGQSLMQDFRTFDPGLEEDTTEASAGTDAVRNFLKTLDKIEPTAKIRVNTDAVGTAIEAVIAVGQEGTLIWGQFGTAAGEPKWGVQARVVKSNIVMQYDDISLYDVVWKVIDGAYVHDGRTAVWS